MSAKGLFSLLRPSKSVAIGELSGSAGSNTITTSRKSLDAIGRRTQSTSLPDAFLVKTYPANADSYELLGECGRGATGSVYRALCKPLNEVVAIKIMDLDDANSRLDRAAYEATSMRYYNHPNILELYCSFVNEHELWLVVPYLDCGSCLDIIERSYQQGLDEVVIATIVKEVLKALDYIHKSGGLHRDVKAANIIIGRDGSVKLADFGLGGHMPRAKHWASHTWDEPQVVGTPCWMAPEVVTCVNKYDSAADVWSLGIAVIEMAQGYAPWSHLSALDVLNRIISSPPPSLEAARRGFSQAMCDFVNQCLNKNPAKRATVAQLLDHKFVKQARDAQWLKRSILENLPTVSGDLNYRCQRSPSIQHSDWPASDTSWDFSSISKGGFLLNYARTPSSHGGSEAGQQTDSDPASEDNTCSRSDLQSVFSHDPPFSCPLSEAPTSKSVSQDIGIPEHDLHSLLSESDTARSLVPHTLEPIREVSSFADLTCADTGCSVSVVDVTSPQSSGPVTRLVVGSVSGGRGSSADEPPLGRESAPVISKSERHCGNTSCEQDTQEPGRSKSLPAFDDGQCDSPFSAFKDIPFTNTHRQSYVHHAHTHHAHTHPPEPDAVYIAAAHAFQQAGFEGAVRVLNCAQQLGHIPGAVAVQLAAASVSDDLSKLLAAGMCSGACHRLNSKADVMKVLHHALDQYQAPNN